MQFAIGEHLGAQDKKQLPPLHNQHSLKGSQNSTSLISHPEAMVTANEPAHCESAICSTSCSAGSELRAHESSCSSSIFLRSAGQSSFKQLMNAAANQEALRKRKEREERALYYAALQKAADRVEEALEKLHRSFGVDRSSIEVKDASITMNQAHITRAEHDSTAELALSKIRVQSLLGSLHFQESIQSLKQVWGWLDISTDSGGEQERGYAQLERETDQLTAELSEISNAAHGSIQARQNLDADRLGEFGTELSGYADEQRRRDAEALREKRGAIAASNRPAQALQQQGDAETVNQLDSDAMQLELQIGLLRGQLLKREASGGAKRHPSSANEALVAETDGQFSSDLAEKAAQMREITGIQAKELSELRQKDSTLDTSIALASKRVTEISSSLAVVRSHLSLHEDDADSYRMTRRTDQRDLQLAYEETMQTFRAAHDAARDDLIARKIADLRSAHHAEQLELARKRLEELERSGGNAALIALMNEQQEVLDVVANLEGKKRSALEANAKKAAAAIALADAAASVELPAEKEGDSLGLFKRSVTAAKLSAGLGQDGSPAVASLIEWMSETKKSIAGLTVDFEAMRNAWHERHGHISRDASLKERLQSWMEQQADAEESARLAESACDEAERAAKQAEERAFEAEASAGRAEETARLAEEAARRAEQEANEAATKALYGWNPDNAEAIDDERADSTASAVLNPAPYPIAASPSTETPPTVEESHLSEAMLEAEVEVAHLQVPSDEDSMPRARVWDSDEPGKALSAASLHALQELMKESHQASEQRRVFLNLIRDAKLNTGPQNWNDALSWFARHASRWGTECLEAASRLRDETTGLRSAARTMTGGAETSSRTTPSPLPTVNIDDDRQEHADATAEVLAEAEALALAIDSLQAKLKSLSASAADRDEKAETLRARVAAAEKERAQAEAAAKLAAEKAVLARKAAEAAAEEAVVHDTWEAPLPNGPSEAELKAIEAAAAAAKAEAEARAAKAAEAAEAAKAAAEERRSRLEAIRDRLQLVLNAQQQAFGGVGKSAMRRFKMQMAGGQTKVDVMRQQCAKLLEEIDSMRDEIERLKLKLQEETNALEPPPKKEDGRFSHLKSLNEGFEQLEEPRNKLKQLERQVLFWRMRWASRFGEPKGKSLTEMSSDELMSELKEVAITAAAAALPPEPEPELEEPAEADEEEEVLFTMSVDNSYMADLGLVEEPEPVAEDTPPSTSPPSPPPPPPSKAMRLKTLQQASLLARMSAARPPADEVLKAEEASTGSMVIPDDRIRERRRSLGSTGTAVIMTTRRPPKQVVPVIESPKSESPKKLDNLLRPPTPPLRPATPPTHVEVPQPRSITPTPSFGAPSLSSRSPSPDFPSLRPRERAVTSRPNFVSVRHNTITDRVLMTAGSFNDVQDALMKATEALEMISISLRPQGYEAQWDVSLRDLPPLTSRASIADATIGPEGKVYPAGTSAEAQAEYNLEAKLKEFMDMSNLMRRSLAVGPVKGYPPTPALPTPRRSPASSRSVQSSFTRGKELLRSTRTAQEGVARADMFERLATKQTTSAADRDRLHLPSALKPVLGPVFHRRQVRNSSVPVAFSINQKAPEEQHEIMRVELARALSPSPPLQPMSLTRS